MRAGAERGVGEAGGPVAVRATAAPASVQVEEDQVFERDHHQPQCDRDGRGEPSSGANDALTIGQVAASAARIRAHVGR